MNSSDQDITIAQHKLKTAKKNWELTDDGEVLKTHSSLLQPVIYKGIKAILKVPMCFEERRGSALMACWDGEGAAKVFEHDDNSLLMERAVGTNSLKQMVMNGEEDKANKIICSVAAKLHNAACKQIAKLVPLPVWFTDLKPAADKYGGVFTQCSSIAHYLLNNPADISVLHGDIHYDNILDSGTAGWVAIDPKALLGEKGFDFANLFCNPDTKTATSPDRLSKQVKLVAAEAGLDAKRLLQWIAAWCGLSAAWTLIDGEDAELQLIVAGIALNELNNY
jgi:streptomycin 6-kinase